LLFVTVTLDSILENYFGLVYITVDTSNLDPKYMHYPLLPHRLEGRMYNPLGKWVGWYFSEEAKFAMDFGYKVKVIFGYKLDKQSGVFNTFINKYFNKRNSQQTDFNYFKTI